MSLDGVDFRHNSKRRPMTSVETQEVAGRRKAVQHLLDVWEDGKEPRRFEYHHYAGAI